MRHREEPIHPHLGKGVASPSVNRVINQDGIRVESKSRYSHSPTTEGNQRGNIYSAASRGGEHSQEGNKEIFSYPQEKRVGI